MTDFAHDVTAVVGRHLTPPVLDGDIPDDVPLAQLGLTSLASVNLLLALEDSFHISFPDEALSPETFRTIGTIRTVITKIRDDPRH